MKKNIVLSIAVLVLASGLFAYGNNFQGMHGRRNGDCIGAVKKGFHKGNPRMLHRREERLYFLSQINLSDKQIDKIDNFRNQFINVKIEKNGKLKALMFQKQIALKNQNFDKAKELNDKISRIRKEISNARIDFRKNVWNILTKEQKEKAKKIIKSRPYKMKMFQDEDEDNSK